MAHWCFDEAGECAIRPDRQRNDSCGLKTLTLSFCGLGFTSETFNSCSPVSSLGSTGRLPSFVIRRSSLPCPSTTTSVRRVVGWRDISSFGTNHSMRERMSAHELSVSTIRDAHSAPGEQPPATVPLLSVCCLCGLVRDKTGPPSDGGQWVTQQIYRQTHGVSPTDFPLTHTYCPECFVKAQDRVRTFLLEIGALP